MGDIPLRGCPPEPLGNYLKALGIFRLVAQQEDPTVRGYWRNGYFCLSSTRFAKVDEVCDWLLKKCCFTEPIAPWQKGTGFLATGKRKKGANAREQLLEEFAKRIQEVSEVKEILDGELEGREREEWIKDIDSNDKGVKADVQAALHSLLRRSVASREALEWLDAVASPEPGDGGERKIRWFHLLGTSGGGEASGQYISNYFQRLSEVLKGDEEQSRNRLLSSLDGRNGVDLHSTNALAAMYYPFLIESPNSGQKFSREKRVNPWDFVLLIEGTMLWASAATRRLTVTRQIASFPFYCRSSLGGMAAPGPREVEESEKSIASGEVWCPLWERAASFGEIRSLFAEGRAQLRGRQAKYATEFARALSTLGVDHGISGFVRYSLLKRSGSGKQTTLIAVPLETRIPALLHHLDLLHELDSHFEVVRWRIRTSSVVPRRLTIASENVEKCVFAVAGARAEISTKLLDLLVAVTNLDREVAVTHGEVKIKRGGATEYLDVPPAPALSRRWLAILEEDTSEFRLARAISSIVICPDAAQLSERSTAGPLRSYLLPLTNEKGQWAWSRVSRSSVWQDSRPLPANLASILQRRLMDAKTTDEGLPLWTARGADYGDILSFWRGEIDQTRMGELIHALSLIDCGTRSRKSVDEFEIKRDPTPDLQTARVWFDDQRTPHVSFAGNAALPENELASAFALPRVYALLKLCFVGGRLPARPMEGGPARRTGEEPFPPRVPEIISLLLAGRAAEATAVAQRRLRGRGYPTLLGSSRTSEIALTPSECLRLAGMLFIPVARPGVLAALAIKPRKREGD